MPSDIKSITVGKNGCAVVDALPVKVRAGVALLAVDTDTARLKRCTCAAKQNS